MGEAEDGVAVEAVSVVTEGEPSPDAVLVESVKEFQPDLLAWLKKFKLQEPEMLEHMKKLEIYQASDLLKIQESQISSLNLKPAQQARFREGVVSLNAEQKPKTPTKEERDRQRAAAAAAQEAKRAEERAAQVRLEKEKAERLDKERKEKEALAKAKADQERAAKEAATEQERKKRFQDSSTVFGPMKSQRSREPPGSLSSGTPPSTPPPADGSEPPGSASPPIVAAVPGEATPGPAEAGGAAGEDGERETTVATESPEFSFHRDIISEDELREDLMRRKRFHDAQAAAMDARSSLAADKVADLAKQGEPTKEETEEEVTRRLRFQEAQKLAAAKVAGGSDSPRRSEDKAGTGVKLSEDEEERKRRFEENKKKALEAKGDQNKTHGPITLSEEEEERRRRFDENKKKAAEAAAEVERLKREDEEWQRTKGAKAKASPAGSEQGGGASLGAGQHAAVAGADDEGTGGMCGCFGGKKKK